MKKLTRYTNVKDLKASDKQLQPQQPDLKYKTDLIEFIAIMKQHSSSPGRSARNNSPKKSGNGK